MKYFTLFILLLLIPLDNFAQFEYGSEIFFYESKINNTGFYLNKDFPGHPESNMYVQSGSISSLANKALSENLFYGNLKASSENFKDKLDSMIIPERSRDIFNYNISGKMSAFESCLWNSPENCWLNDTREEYIYDNSGNKSSFIILHWVDDDEKWVYDYKEDYEYDENGILKKSIVYTWDDNINQWEQVYVGDNFYDESGNLVDKVYSYLSSGENYMNIYRTEFTYNPQGKLITKIEYFWNESGNNWAKNFKEENFYDNAGNILTYLSFYWDGKKQDWQFKHKSEYSYQSGKLNEIIFSKWNHNAKIWFFDDMYEYQYDSNNNLFAIIYKKWDYHGEDWENNYKEEYLYDNSFSYENLVLPDFANNILFNHKLIKGSFFNYSEGDWENNGEVFLYYSTHENTTFVNNSVKQELNVYPNPSSEYVIFNTGSPGILDIQIYNITGELIVRHNYDNGEIVKTDSFKPGIYFYKVTQSGIIYNGKLIIR